MILIQFDANSFGCIFSDIKKENAVHFTYIIIVLYFKLIKSVICLFEKDSADKSFNLGYKTTLVTGIFDSLKRFSSYVNWNTLVNFCERFYMQHARTAGWTCCENSMLLYEKILSMLFGEFGKCTAMSLVMIICLQILHAINS